MNFRHLFVFIASIIVLMISLFLSHEVLEKKGILISELLSLYSIGAVIGYGLALAWLTGEFSAGTDGRPHNGF